jgi:hypothetical protein
VTTIGLAAASRAEAAEAERRPSFAYIDEFQSFTTLAVVEMLTEMRKYAMGFTMAHQYLHQLAPEYSARHSGQRRNPDRFPARRRGRGNRLARVTRRRAAGFAASRERKVKKAELYKVRLAKFARIAVALSIAEGQNAYTENASVCVPKCTHIVSSRSEGLGDTGGPSNCATDTSYRSMNSGRNL